MPAVRDLLPPDVLQRYPEETLRPNGRRLLSFQIPDDASPEDVDFVRKSIAERLPRLTIAATNPMVSPHRIEAQRDTQRAFPGQPYEVAAARLARYERQPRVVRWMDQVGARAADVLPSWKERPLLDVSDVIPPPQGLDERIAGGIGGALAFGVLAPAATLAAAPVAGPFAPIVGPMAVAAASPGTGRERAIRAGAVGVGAGFAAGVTGAATRLATAQAARGRVFAVRAGETAGAATERARQTVDLSIAKKASAVSTAASAATFGAGVPYLETIGRRLTGERGAQWPTEQQVIENIALVGAAGATAHVARFGGRGAGSRSTPPASSARAPRPTSPPAAEPARIERPGKPPGSTSEPGPKPAPAGGQRISPRDDFAPEHRRVVLGIAKGNGKQGDPRGPLDSQAGNPLDQGRTRQQGYLARVQDAISQGLPAQQAAKRARGEVKALWALHETLRPPEGARAEPQVRDAARQAQEKLETSLSGRQVAVTPPQETVPLQGEVYAVRIYPYRGTRDQARIVLKLGDGRLVPVLFPDANAMYAAIGPPQARQEAAHAGPEMVTKTAPTQAAEPGLAPAPLIEGAGPKPLSKTGGAGGAEVRPELQAGAGAISPTIGEERQGVPAPPTSLKVPRGTSLPTHLSGAKPRYYYGSKQFEVAFGSDLDRAAYIVAQTKKSKRDPEYRSFLRSHGMTDAEMEARGARVKAAIKEMAKQGDPATGPLRIEKGPETRVERAARGPGETAGRAEPRPPAPAPSAEHPPLHEVALAEVFAESGKATRFAAMQRAGATDAEIESGVRAAFGKGGGSKSGKLEYTYGPGHKPLFRWKDEAGKVQTANIHEVVAMVRKGMAIGETAPSVRGAAPAPTRNYKPGTRVSVPYTGRSSYFGNKIERTTEKGRVLGYVEEGGETRVHVQVKRGKRTESHNFLESQVRRLPKRLTAEQRAPLARAKLEKEFAGSPAKARERIAKLRAAFDAAEEQAKALYPQHGEPESRPYLNARAKMNRVRDLVDIVGQIVRAEEFTKAQVAFGPSESGATPIFSDLAATAARKGGKLLSGAATKMAELEGSIELATPETVKVFHDATMLMWDRYVTSGGALLRPLGGSGRALADAMDGAWKAWQSSAGKIVTEIGTRSKKESRDQREAVGKALHEGGAETPDIAETIASMRDALKTRIDDAKLLGLREQTAKGPLVAIREKAHYFPQVAKAGVRAKLAKEGTKEHQRQIDYMIEKHPGKDRLWAELELDGWAHLPGEIRHGALQHERAFDLAPEFREWDYAKVLPAYFLGADRRIETARVFGPSEAMAKKLLRFLPTERGIRKSAALVVKGFLDPNVRELQGVAQRVNAFLVVSFLSTAGIIQPAQAINIGSRYGYFKMLRGYAGLLNQGMRVQAESTGAAVQEQVQDMVGAGKGIAGHWVRIIGLEQLDRANRIAAAIAGRIAATDWARDLAARPDNARLRRRFTQHGIDPDEVVRHGGILTPDQRRGFALEAANQTQFASRPTDLPAGRNTVHGKFVYLFKSFTLQQGRFVKERVRDAKNGDPEPLIAYLLGMATVGAGFGELVVAIREWLTGKKRRKKKLFWRWVEDMTFAGSLGIAADAIRAFASGPEYIFSLLAGPAASEGLKFLGEAGAVATSPFAEDRGKAWSASSRKLLRHAIARTPLLGTRVADWLVPSGKNPPLKPWHPPVDPRKDKAEVERWKVGAKQDRPPIAP